MSRFFKSEKCVKTFAKSFLRCNDSYTCGALFTAWFSFVFRFSGRFNFCVLFHLIFFLFFSLIVCSKFFGEGGLSLAWNTLLISVGGSKFLLDGLLGGLRQIRCLYVLLHTDQRLFQSVEGTRVQHLLLDFGRVGTPRHQKQLLFLGSLKGKYTHA